MTLLSAIFPTLLSLLSALIPTLLSALFFLFFVLLDPTVLRNGHDLAYNPVPPTIIARTYPGSPNVELSTLAWRLLHPPVAPIQLIRLHHYNLVHEVREIFEVGPVPGKLV